MSSATRTYDHTVTVHGAESGAEVEAELEAAWRHLAGVAPTAPAAALDGLLARLREPHRKYHRAAHVAAVLRHVEVIVATGPHLAAGPPDTDGTSGVGGSRGFDGSTGIDGSSGPDDTATDAARRGPLDVDAIRWAALYHDAIYDPRATDNEERSADLAVSDAAEAGWPAARCGTVRRLVMATAGHRATAVDEAVLIDADLAILGGTPTEYATYVRGVRAEYGHVTDEGWATGRAAVLRSLLAIDPLYRTTALRPRQAQARANLAGELAALEAATR